MAKPRFYGKTTAYIPNKRRDLRFIKKNQRNREKASCNPVAVQLPTGKEAQA